MSNKTKNIIITVLFSVFIIFFMFINIVITDTDISLTERRKLARFPQISLSSLLDGNFANNFDKYSMDQFIYRDNFRKLKTFLEFNIFKKRDVNNIYLYNGTLIKKEYPLNIKSVKNVSSKINNIRSLYLNDSNKVYYSVIPDKNFFISDDYLRIDYEKMINILKKDLADIKYIDLFDSLTLDDYYYTDTHFKQTNLEKVVNKIASEMSLKDRLKTSYEVKELSDFNGVLTGQMMLDSKKDKISIMQNKIIDEALVYNIETDKVEKVYNLEKLNGYDKYDVFLQGATPLLYIENKNALNNDSLVVFRDSFGSSLVPLLIEAYKTIYVVDIRYISSYYLENYIDFQNKDILFIYSSLLINNSSTLK